MCIIKTYFKLASLNKFDVVDSGVFFTNFVRESDKIRTKLK
jgi:hypothetical protein